MSTHVLIIPDTNPAILNEAWCGGVIISKPQNRLRYDTERSQGHFKQNEDSDGSILIIREFEFIIQIYVNPNFLTRQNNIQVERESVDVGECINMGRCILALLGICKIRLD